MSNRSCSLSTREPQLRALLRIVVAFLFLQHATAKLFGVPHVEMFDGLQLMSLLGVAGMIELVVEGLTGDPESDWLFETNGAGIMVAEPKVFGRVYLPDPHEKEDLVFVARAQ